MHDYRKLRVWQEGRELVRVVYDASAKFPGSEQFGLINQARRAAVPIPSNIAEGSGRSSQIDYARFIDIAVGSACELETLFLLAEDLAYIGDGDNAMLLERIARVRRMLVRFRQRLRSDLRPSRPGRAAPARSLPPTRPL